MTRYEQGFLTKCAEYGVPLNTASNMLKMAKETRDHGEGALLGAKIGLGAGATFGGLGVGGVALEEALTKKMNLKMKILAVLAGIGGGAAVFGVPGAFGGAALGGLIGRKNKPKTLRERLFGG